MLGFLVVLGSEVRHQLLALAETKHVRVLALEVLVKSLRLVLILQISQILQFQLPGAFLRLIPLPVPTQRCIFEILAALLVLQLPESFLIHPRRVPDQGRSRLLPQHFLNFLRRQLVLRRLISLTAPQGLKLLVLPFNEFASPRDFLLALV